MDAAWTTCHLAYSNLPEGITRFVLKWTTLGVGGVLVAVLLRPLGTVLRSGVAPPARAQATNRPSALHLQSPGPLLTVLSAWGRRAVECRALLGCGGLRRNAGWALPRLPASAGCPPRTAKHSVSLKVLCVVLVPVAVAATMTTLSVLSFGPILMPCATPTTLPASRRTAHGASGSYIVGRWLLLSTFARAMLAALLPAGLIFSAGAISQVQQPARAGARDPSFCPGQRSNLARASSSPQPCRCDSSCYHGMQLGREGSGATDGGLLRSCGRMFRRTGIHD